MDHHKFEDLISSYIENELSLKKRKEVEKYLINNPDAQELVEDIKINIAQLKKLPKLKVNKNFNKKLLNNIDRYGNTTSATIPILLTEAYHKNLIKKGDFILIAAFGSGFIWGASIIQW